MVLEILPFVTVADWAVILTACLALPVLTKTRLTITEQTNTTAIVDVMIFFNFCNQIDFFSDYLYFSQKTNN